MFDLIASNVRLTELEGLLREYDYQIQKMRNEREYSEDRAQQAELTRQINFAKAQRDKTNQQISSLKSSISGFAKSQDKQAAASQTAAAKTKAAVSKLADINAAQAQIGAQQSYQAQAAKPDAGAMQQVASAAAQTPPATAQQPQQPAGVLPAFTKFSGLGASQMRQQMSAPSQNVTGTQQNAFTLPNAQGLKFGGS